MAQQESWKRDTEETGCQPPEGPVLCANGCGFFGSAATMNLCSKCYRDHLLKQTKKTNSATTITTSSSGKAVTPEKALFSTTPTIIPTTTTQSSSDGVSLERTDPSVRQAASEPIAVIATSSSDSPIDGGTSSKAAAKEQGHTLHQQAAAPNRCFSCKKRVGLTGFKCRCGDTFCSVHRYSDKHSCTFDHKSAGRDAIAKANPVVKADKIQKI